MRRPLEVMGFLSEEAYRRLVYGGDILVWSPGGYIFPSGRVISTFGGSGGILGDLAEIRAQTRLHFQKAISISRFVGNFATLL